MQQNGKNVTTKAIAQAKNGGATDREIHDTVLVTALFCLYHKKRHGLASVTPTDTHFHENLGKQITTNGYNRLEGGYDPLKSDG